MICLKMKMKKRIRLLKLAVLRATVRRASEHVAEWPGWKRAITIVRDNGER